MTPLSQASKHLVRRYLDPKNIPKTPSQEVFGSLVFFVAHILPFEFLYLDKDGLVGWVLVRDDKKRAMLEF